MRACTTKAVSRIIRIGDDRSAYVDEYKVIKAISKIMPFNSLEYSNRLLKNATLNYQTHVFVQRTKSPSEIICCSGKAF